LSDIDTVQHAVICCGGWNVSEHSGWPYPCDIFWFANSETTLGKIARKFRENFVFSQKKNPGKISGKLQQQKS